MAEPIRCGTTLEDGTGDNLDLRRLRAGGDYVLKLRPRRRSVVLVKFLGGGAAMLAISTAT